MDYDYQVSEERPIWIIQLLKQFPQLNDLTMRYTDEDKNVECLFGDYNRGMGTGHTHDFTFRINKKRLWLCKNCIGFLQQLFKEFPSSEIPKLVGNT